MKLNQAELDLLVLTAQNGSHKAFGLREIKRVEIAVTRSLVKS